jgi:hypothetical protein
MNPDDEFAEILRSVATMPDYEKAEALLTYFSRSIQTMDTRSLQQFRNFCWSRNEGTEAESTMLEIIDGQLALREINAAK